MSERHFLIECQADRCWVRDLGSTNGIFVNDQQVAESPLYQDDILRAGDTTFKVEVVGQPATIERAQPVVVTPFPKTPPLPKSAAKKSKLAAEICPSGLLRGWDESQQLPFGEFVERLTLVSGLYCVLDFGRLEMPIPASIPAPDYLFDWMDPAVAAVASPIVISAAEVKEWPQYIADCFGNDALVCLFSAQDKDAILVQLRELVRPPAGSKRQGVLGICWPHVLGAWLKCSEAATVTKVFAGGIECILIENPDLADQWQLFGTPDLPKFLKQAAIECLVAVPEGQPEPDS